MMRTILLGAAIAAAAAVPTGASANHAGCAATTAAPVCTYTAIGAHQAVGFSDGGFEAWVTRSVNGEDTKVVVGRHEGGVTGLVDVEANFNELVTLELLEGDNGVVGVVSSGNTSGHLPV